MRLGGEEFGLLFPDTPAEGAVIAAERVRQRIEETPFPIASGPLPVTVSMSVVERMEKESHFDSTYKTADQALYRAKRNGRNQVQLAQDKDRP